MPNYNNNHKHEIEKSCNDFVNDSKYRPTSALLRGVKITEFHEDRINPEPVTTKEINFFVGDALSPIRLRSMTGCDDLTLVDTLELIVNTNEKSLGNFGEHLPNLNYLKLLHSSVPVLRDLGSYLDNLKILHMCQCGVSDLDGLSMMVSLRELYLAYNNITDISSCGLLEHLSILDVEGNNVSDFSQLSFLGLCSNLTSLTLEGNPICIRTHPNSNEADYNYKEAVLNEITHLKVLDGNVVSNIKSTVPLIPSKDRHNSIKKCDSPDRTNVLNLLDDWDTIDNLIEDNNISTKNQQSTVFNSINIDRPMMQMSPSLHPAINRPGSSLKFSGFKFKSENNDSRVTTGYESEVVLDANAPLNISTNAASLMMNDQDISCSEKAPKTSTSISSGIFSASSLEFPTMDESSGIVFCGNLARAMRFRKPPPSLKNLLMKEDDHPTDLSPVLPKKTAFVGLSETTGNLDVDLEDMKNEIKKSIEQIKIKKSPQVLKIIQYKTDDAICLSDDDDDEETEDHVTFHRTGFHETQKNEIDKKRESLESFADYFIELSSEPIDPESKLFRHDSDLDRFYDKESHRTEGSDRSDAARFKASRFRRRGYDEQGKQFATSFEVQTSSKTFLSNLQKNKKHGVRLHPLPRIDCSSLTSIYSNNSSTTDKNSSKKISTNTTKVPNLQDKNIMKAASQFLRTGRIADSSF